MVQIDSTIIVQCRRGDKDAFRTVVHNYQRLVFSLALKMLCDEEEAKDVAQETFIRVWQRIADFDTRRPFATWLYTIASRLCLDRLKAKKALVAQPDDIDVLRKFASDDDSQRTLENSEWVSIVRTLAEGLGAKQRLVFTLCLLEGLSTQEAEQITGMDARQITTNLYVARQTIRQRLKDLGYE